MFEPLLSIQFDHEEQTRQARLLGILLIGQVIGSMSFLLLFILLWLFYPSFPFFPLLFPLLSGLSCLPVYWLLRQGRLSLAGYTLVISNFVFITGAMYAVGGFRGPAPIIYFWPIVAAGIAIDLRASFVFATASTFLYLALAAVELRGLYSPPVQSDVTALFVADLGIPVFMFFLLAFLSCLSANSLQQALRKVRQRAADLDAQLKENEVLTAKLQSQLERDELLIGQLQETANVLAPAAEELSAASEETNATAEQIAFTVQQVAHGAQVTVLDALLPMYGGNLFNLQYILPDITFIQGDIRDGELMRRLVIGCDYIFSLAGQVSYVDSNADPLLDLDINCHGHLQLLEACRMVNKRARVFFASSRFVYGRIEYNPVNENHPFNCLSIYGIHKLAGEKYYRFYNEAYGLPTVSARIANPYGPRQQMKHSKYGILNWFIRLALEGQPLTVYGDGL